MRSRGSQHVRERARAAPRGRSPPAPARRSRRSPPTAAVHPLPGPPPHPVQRIQRAAPAGPVPNTSAKWTAIDLWEAAARRDRKPPNTTSSAAHKPASPNQLPCLPKELERRDNKRRDTHRPAPPRPSPEHELHLAQRRRGGRILLADRRGDRHEVVRDRTSAVRTSWWAWRYGWRSSPARP